MANDFSGESNLIALYNLENGALANDSSGKGETLTVASVTADVVNFKEGSASALSNATPDELRRADGSLGANFPGKDGTSNRTFSVCCWIRPSTLASTNYIVNKWKAPPNQQWAINVNATNARILISGSGSDAESLTHAGTVISTGQWYHLGCTYNGATKAWRVRVWDDNGSSVAESTGTGSLTMHIDDPNFQLFNLDGGNNGFVGNLDEVVIFDRAITAAEIDQIRAGTFPAIAPYWAKILTANPANIDAFDYCRLTANDILGRSYAEVKEDLNLEIGTDVLAQQTIGIADDNLLEVDGDPNDDEYARFTANGLEGRTEAEFKADFNLQIGTDVLAEQTIGIADDNLVEIDDADAADNDYAKFTANGLEGRDYSEVLGDLSGQAGAAFDFNSQALTSVGAIGCGVVTGTGVATFEGASVTVGKASTTTGTLVLHDSNSANTITLTVPDISAGSLSFTLPPTDGDNTNVLQTDGNGVLTWVAAGAGGVSTWIALTDTDPANYAGDAGKYVKVNAGETGLDFGSPTPGSGWEYVDRGDPAANDFAVGDFTTDGTWNDLDLSGIIGTGVKLVHLRVSIEDGAANSGMYFRENGNSNAYNFSGGATAVANVDNHIDDCFVMCDSNGVIEYLGSNLAFTRIDLVVRGWFVGSGSSDGKVKIDSGATADYLGAASNDGVLRTGAGLDYADGGNFVTLTVDVDGLAEIGAALVDADTFIVDDGDGGTTKKCTMSRLATYIGAGGGGVVQVVNVQTGAVNTGATVLPLDDTIPQSGEGNEFMTLAITPTNASNKLKIEVVAQLASSAAAAQGLSLALFQDATAGALAANYMVGTAADYSYELVIIHYMTAGTTSETTFKVRGGAHAAATVTFNGTAAGRIFGGVIASSITITEIEV